MSLIVAVSSSPSAHSRTDVVLREVSNRLASQGHRIERITLRDLPAQPLLLADTSYPSIAAAVELIEQADAVIIATPVYKASFSGLLKTFLDLLPQTALRDKIVLPLATGGTPAHVLVIDYALRPVLASLGTTHITPGWFVLAGHVTLHEDGTSDLHDLAARPLFDVTDIFGDAIVRAGIPERRAAIA